MTDRQVRHLPKMPGPTTRELARFSVRLTPYANFVKAKVNVLFTRFFPKLDWNAPASAQQGRIPTGPHYMQFFRW